jgi:hypothetical protein
MMVKGNFYIVATYLSVPKKGIKTGKPEMQTNETLKCVKNLKRRDQTDSSVILDVANQKVIKNRFSEIQSFEELYQYYITNFGDYINDWLKMQLVR